MSFRLFNTGSVQPQLKTQTQAGLGLGVGGLALLLAFGRSVTLTHNFGQNLNLCILNSINPSLAPAIITVPWYLPWLAFH